MARLRFPGRPGQRFGRNCIKFVSDDLKLHVDPSIKVSANIEKGLKLFYDIFGFSEEEEDFDGFKKEDLIKARAALAAKVKRKNALERYLQTNPSLSSDSSDRDKHTSGSSESDESSSSSLRGRSGMRDILRKSYDRMIKEGLCKPVVHKQSAQPSNGSKTPKFYLKNKAPFSSRKPYLRKAYVQQSTITLRKHTKESTSATENLSKVNDENKFQPKAVGKSATKVITDADVNNILKVESDDKLQPKEKVTEPTGKSIAKRLLEKAKHGCGKSRRKQKGDLGRHVKKKFSKKFKFSASKRKHKQVQVKKKTANPSSKTNKRHKLPNDKKFRKKPVRLSGVMTRRHFYSINQNVSTVQEISEKCSKLTPSFVSEQILPHTLKDKKHSLSVGRKKFVLPPVSARSSRKIIPRKRYLDEFESSVHYPKNKRVREDDSESTKSTCSSVSGTIPAMDSSPEHTEFEGEKQFFDSQKKIGLLDQPLVVEGKRPWKPSLKVQMKLSEMNYESPFGLRKCDDRSSGTGTSSGSFKDIIKPDMVSKYADIMAKKTKEKTVKSTDVIKKATQDVCKSAADVPKVGNLESAEGEDKRNEDKLEKVAAKIEKLLKSQWEGRLKKTDSHQTQTSDLASKDPLLLPSKFESSISRWKSELHQQRASNQRRTKSIIRKARLQLKKRTLMKLRQPDSIKILSEQLQPEVTMSKVPSFSDRLHSLPGSTTAVEADVPLKSKRLASSARFGQPGTIICSICGLVKYYSHVQRRYRQFSCEPCSKFFGNFAKNPKQYYCPKIGNCSIQSSSSNGKSSSRVSIAGSRCKACWLKVCMQKFTVSAFLREQLMKFVPRLESSHHPLITESIAVLQESLTFTDLARSAKTIEVKQMEAERDTEINKDKCKGKSETESLQRKESEISGSDKDTAKIDHEQKLQELESKQASSDIETQVFGKQRRTRKLKQDKTDADTMLKSHYEQGTQEQLTEIKNNNESEVKDAESETKENEMDENKEQRVQEDKAVSSELNSDITKSALPRLRRKAFEVSEENKKSEFVKDVTKPYSEKDELLEETSTVKIKELPLLQIEEKSDSFSEQESNISVEKCDFTDEKTNHSQFISFQDQKKKETQKGKPTVSTEKLGEKSRENSQVKERSSSPIQEAQRGAFKKRQGTKPVPTLVTPTSEAQSLHVEEGKPRGPRIKHVCRRAAVVLGQPRATFPQPKEKERFSLSALPQEEKQKILETETGRSTPDTNDLPLDKLIKRTPGKDTKEAHEPKEESPLHFLSPKKTSVSVHGRSKKKKSLMKKSFKRLHKHSLKKSLKFSHKNPVKNPIKYSYKSTIKASIKSAIKLPIKNPARPATKIRFRKVRCKECEGCLAEDCGQCVYCLDKKKFGGPNLIKQACMFRRCLRPVLPTAEKKATKPPPEGEGDGKPSGGHSSFGGGGPSGIGASLSPSSSSSPSTSPDGSNGSSCGSSCSSTSSSSSSGSSSGSSSSSSSSSGSTSDNNSSHCTNVGNNCCKTSKQHSSNTVCSKEISGKNRNSNPSACKTSCCSSSSSCNVSGSVSLIYVSSEVETKDNLSFDNSGKTGKSTLSGQKLPVKKLIQQKDKNMLYTKQASNHMAECSLTQKKPKKKKHVIYADYWEEYDSERIWSQGFALISSQCIALQSACFLCGSSGEEKLIYCVVCCEPYHTFCLDEDDVPLKENVENWCCYRCQSCAVCGQKSNLLKCKKCQNTYHAECLGPHYPSKPSRKKRIWVCPKCVKCKSCGTTSPTAGSGLLWNFDLLLCQSCSKLTDKGNFCPICQKCYEDDDYESQMVQCSKCCCWVHAKCDTISDEMYEILSCLPETVVYTCFSCTTDWPPVWKIAANDALKSGLSTVLSALLHARCTRHLVSRKITERKLNCKNNHTIARSKKDSKNALQDLRWESDEKNDSGHQSSVNISHEETVLENGLNKDIYTRELVSTSSPLKNSCLYNTKLLIQALNKQCELNVKHSSLSESTENKVDSSKPSTSESTENKVDSSKPSMSESTENKVDSSKPSMSECHSKTINNATQLFSKSLYNCETLSLNCEKNENVKMNDTVKNCNESTQNFQTLHSVNKEANINVIENIPFTTNKEQLELCDTNIQEEERCVKTSEHPLSNSNISIMEIVTDCPSEITALLKNNDGDIVLLDAENLTGYDGNISVNASTDFQSLVTLTENEETCTSITVETNGSIVVPLPSNDKEIFAIPVNVTISKSPKQDTSNSDDIAPITTPASDLAIKEADQAVSPQTLKIVFKDGHPRDLMSVKKKLDEGKYDTVEEFFEEVVQIIRFGSFEGKKLYAHTARSMFAKQMEKVFPWFRISQAKLWDGERGYLVPDGLLPDAIVPPNDDHMYAQYLTREIKNKVAQPGKLRLSGDIPCDPRKCILCGQQSDDVPSKCGRLLYCGQDDWIHVNCALWSAEVFQEFDGSLQNVYPAISRGKFMRCESCNQIGATVGCCIRGCPANYHFYCARKEQAVFQEDKKVFCVLHHDSVDEQILDDDEFPVRQCVHVGQEEIAPKWVKKSWQNGLSLESLCVVIGSLTVESFGYLTSASDWPEVLVPVNYKCTRIFWSTKNPHQRVVYTCRTIEVKPESLASKSSMGENRTIAHNVESTDFSGYLPSSVNSDICDDHLSSLNSEAVPEVAFNANDLCGTSNTEQESHNEELDDCASCDNLCYNKKLSISLQNCAQHSVISNCSKSPCTVSPTIITARAVLSDIINNVNESCNEDDCDKSDKNNHNSIDEEKHINVRQSNADSVNCFSDVEHKDEYKLSESIFNYHSTTIEKSTSSKSCSLGKENEYFAFSLNSGDESNEGITVKSTTVLSESTKNPLNEFIQCIASDCKMQVKSNKLLEPSPKKLRACSPDTPNKESLQNNCILSNEIQIFNISNKQMNNVPKNSIMEPPKINHTECTNEISVKSLDAYNNMSQVEESILCDAKITEDFSQMHDKISSDSSVTENGKQFLPVMKLNNDLSYVKNNKLPNTKNVNIPVGENMSVSESIKCNKVISNSFCDNIDRLHKESKIANESLCSVDKLINDCNCVEKSKIDGTIKGDVNCNIFIDTQIDSESNQNMNDKKIEYKNSEYSESEIVMEKLLNILSYNDNCDRISCTSEKRCVKRNSLHHPGNTVRTLIENLESCSPSNENISSTDLCTESTNGENLNSQDVNPTISESLVKNNHLLNNKLNHSIQNINEKCLNTSEEVEIENIKPTQAERRKMRKILKTYPLRSQRYQDSIKIMKMLSEREVERELKERVLNKYKQKGYSFLPEKVGCLLETVLPACSITETVLPVYNVAISQSSEDCKKKCSSSQKELADNIQPRQLRRTPARLSVFYSQLNTVNDTSKESINSNKKHKTNDLISLENDSGIHNHNLGRDNVESVNNNIKSVSKERAKFNGCVVSEACEIIKVNHEFPSVNEIKKESSNLVVNNFVGFEAYGKHSCKKTVKNIEEPSNQGNNECKSNVLNGKITLGPFKCDKCKRLYRTKESFDKHVESCDFIIDSSSTDEDEETPRNSPVQNSQFDNQSKTNLIVEYENKIMKNTKDTLEHKNKISDDEINKPMKANEITNNTVTNNNINSGIFKEQSHNMPSIKIPLKVQSKTEADSIPSQVSVNESSKTASNYPLICKTDGNVTSIITATTSTTASNKSVTNTAPKLPYTTAVSSCTENNYNLTPLKSPSNVIKSTLTSSSLISRKHPILHKPQKSRTTESQPVSQKKILPKITSCSQQPTVGLPGQLAHSLFGSQNVADYGQMIVDASGPSVSMDINSIPLVNQTLSNSASETMVGYGNNIYSNSAPDLMQVPGGTLIFPAKTEIMPAASPIINHIPSATNNFTSVLPPTLGLSQSPQLSYVGSITITNSETMSLSLNVPGTMLPNVDLVPSQVYSHQNVAFSQPSLMPTTMQMQPTAGIQLSTVNVQQISLQSCIQNSSLGTVMFPQQASVASLQNPIMYVGGSGGTPGHIGAIPSCAQPSNLMVQIPVEAAQQPNCSYQSFIGTANNLHSEQDIQHITLNQYALNPNIQSTYQLHSEPEMLPTLQTIHQSDPSHCPLEHSVDHVIKSNKSSISSVNGKLDNIQPTISDVLTKPNCYNFGTAENSSLQEIKPASRTSVIPSPDISASDQSVSETNKEIPQLAPNSQLVDILRKAAQQMLSLSVQLAKKQSEPDVTTGSLTTEIPAKKPRFAHTRKVAARKAQQLKNKLIKNHKYPPPLQSTQVKVQTKSVQLNLENSQKPFTFPLPAPQTTSNKEKELKGPTISKSASINATTAQPSVNLRPLLPAPPPSHDACAISKDPEDEESPLLALHMQQEKQRLQQEGEPPKDKPYIMFEISSEDGFYVKSSNIHEAWQTVYDKLQDARVAAHMKQITLSQEDVDGIQMMGLNNSAMMYLLEQLPGAENCVKYNFSFHPPSREQDEVLETISGCARAEQYATRKEYDMFNFLASEHRKRPLYVPLQDEEEGIHKSARRATSMDLPMAMRFRHLKTIAREAVGVYRSRIHGRGLFCKRNIDPGELVIEYAGEVIRSVLTDKRERIYQSKGIGCYMFRIDDDEVVDATMHGNAARFINHSCEPNCYSKVITVDGKKHIVIFALRRIIKGEELTYDYKFPFEEEKIPCTCNSRRCRKYLN